MDRALNIRQGVAVAVCTLWIVLLLSGIATAATIIDHNHTDITMIPQSAIERAKSVLHIAYGHTSHGSQLTSGMSGLVTFANNGGLGLSLPNNIFAWNDGGSGGALDLEEGDGYGSGWLDHDVGYYPNWINETRAYLDDPSHADVNVVMWSWCGQVNGYTEQQMIDRYLTPMSQLEAEYPNVTFVYMTGHAEGTGEAGNLHLRNQQIRAYCIANNKVLYDFYDIESYDPDGNYYGNKNVDDDCTYDSDGNGSRDANWAIEWQNAHTEGVDWYHCSSAHSQPLNANRKAYAAWWLWAVLGGWNPSGTNRAPVLSPIGDQTVDANQTLTLSLSATDPDSGDQLTFGMNPTIPGAILNTTSGAFNWTPASSDDGDHIITFSVTDDGTPQASDQETITITVVDPGNPASNRAPVLAPVGDHEVEVNQKLEISLSATDPDNGDQLTYSMNPVIPGADLDSTSGAFSWTPAPGDDGDYSIAFTATDDGTPQASDSETITVSVTPESIRATSNTVSNNGTGGGSGSSGCFIGVIKDAVNDAPGY